MVLSLPKVALCPFAINPLPLFPGNYCPVFCCYSFAVSRKSYKGNYIKYSLLWAAFFFYLSMILSYWPLYFVRDNKTSLTLTLLPVGFFYSLQLAILLPNTIMALLLKFYLFFKILQGVFMILLLSNNDYFFFELLWYFMPQ